jgi:hypothetical protein
LGALVPPDQFELSTLRASITEHPGPLSVSLLLQAPSQNQRLLDALRFRLALADEILGALRKNAGKSGIICIEMRCSAVKAAVLYDSPGLPAVSVKMRSNGNNRISYVVTSETILKPALLKELLVLKMDSPKPLKEPLGEFK